MNNENFDKFDKIVEIINGWDPIGLFPIAPQDEYYDEVRLIMEFVEKNKDIEAEGLEGEIKSIFLRMFGDDIYSGKNQEHEIANKILKCLLE